jgi:hypothetical protein
MKSVMKFCLRSVASALVVAALLTGSMFAQSSKAQPTPAAGKVKRTHPHPIMKLSLAPVPYRLASPCNLQNPVLTLFVKVQNVGDAPSSKTRINVIDSSLAPPWQVQAPLQGLSPGESAAVDISVSAYSPSAAMAGNHTFRFTAVETITEDFEVSPAPELHVTIPRGFCTTSVKGVIQPPAFAAPKLQLVTLSATSAPLDNRVGDWLR